MTNTELLNAILGAGYVLGTAMRKNILNADSIMMERYAKKYGVAVKSEIELEHDQFWAKVAEYRGLRSELTSVTRGFYADEEEAAKIREKMETLRNYLNANCIKIGERSIPMNFGLLSGKCLAHIQWWSIGEKSV